MSRRDVGVMEAVAATARGISRSSHEVGHEVGLECCLYRVGGGRGGRWSMLESVVFGFFHAVGDGKGYSTGNQTCETDGMGGILARL